MKPQQRQVKQHPTPIAVAPPPQPSIAPLAPVSDLLTVDQAAKYLNVSKFWVYDHTNGRRDPKVPHLRFGGAIRIRRATLDRMIAELEAQSA